MADGHTPPKAPLTVDTPAATLGALQYGLRVSSTGPTLTLKPKRCMKVGVASNTALMASGRAQVCTLGGADRPRAVASDAVAGRQRRAPECTP